MIKCINHCCDAYDPKDKHGCKLNIDIKQCAYVRAIPIITPPPKKPQPKNHNIYQGKLNLHHLVADSIKDNKKCFLAICEDRVVVGVSRQIGSEKIPSDLLLPCECKSLYESGPYFLFTITRDYIDITIPKLKEMAEIVRKKEQRNIKAIRKQRKSGELSNKFKNKVMTW